MLTKKLHPLPQCRPRPIPPEIAKQLKDMVEVQRLQHWKIVEILGLPKKRIYKWIHRLGLKTQRTGPRSGPGHPEWKGGRNIDKDGYILIYMPDHPSARKVGSRARYILEHRLVMEKHLGRLLERTEVVHHRDGNKQNNSIENLELFAKNSDHLRFELTGRVPNWTPDGKLRILAGVAKSARLNRKHA